MVPSTSLQPIVREGLSVLEIAGARASVSASHQGAHVYAWTPRGARPVLFLSPRSAFAPGKAIRGGVPVCFPWFGPKADNPAAPQHGFARIRDWTLQQAETTADGTVCLEFQLASDAATRAVWPHDFTARLSVAAGDRLKLALRVDNVGAAPLTFGAALHTYLAVSDVRRIAICGLEDTDYLDKVAGGARRRDGAVPVVLSGETDRVYVDTATACVVEDPGWSRRIHISKSGSRSTVVWNPWADKARAMADLGGEAWTGFVCVEACNTGDDTVTLAPGATHTLATEISVSPF